MVHKCAERGKITYREISFFENITSSKLKYPPLCEPLPNV